MCKFLWHILWHLGVFPTFDCECQESCHITKNQDETNKKFHILQGELDIYYISFGVHKKYVELKINLLKFKSKEW